MKKMIELKVMEFNVLHGFHKPDRFPFKGAFVLNEERLIAGKEIVRRENPDVLVLTEACFGEEFEGIRMDYGDIFGFGDWRFARRNHEWGAAILSRFPIVDFYDSSAAEEGNYARAEIDVDGKKVNVAVIHPKHSLGEADKKKFFERVLGDVDERYILAGDFNCVSDEDEFDGKKIYSGLVESLGLSEARELVDRWSERMAIHYVRSKGLVDTFRAVHPSERAYTIPTDFLSTDKRSGVRLDYIFCSRDFEVKDAYVVKGDLAEEASDHYPIVSNLRLS